jgi:hypothetical protein
MVNNRLVWLARPVGGGLVVGAIVAIVAAFLITKTEYHSAQRLEDSRVNAQLRLIGTSASQFDPLVQQYISLAIEKNYSEARNYYGSLFDDARMETMTDLNAMPTSDWPSNEVHHAFKEYFFSSIMVMETSADEGTSIKLQDRVSAYGTKFEALKKALEASRR